MKAVDSYLEYDGLVLVRPSEVDSLVPWINTLVGYLEDYRGYKLYIPERDMLIGCLKSEEINQVALNSRFVLSVYYGDSRPRLPQILVCSPELAKSSGLLLLPMLPLGAIKLIQKGVPGTRMQYTEKYSLQFLENLAKVLCNKPIGMIDKIRTSVRKIFVNEFHDNTPNQIQGGKIQIQGGKMQSYDLKSSRRIALVLYNTENREGAFEEADKLTRSLLKAGCDVQRIEWLTANVDLNRKITQAFRDITTSYSLMFVCIMAHGRNGRVAGSSDTEIPINDILLTLTNALPPTVPLVVLIQACQGDVVSISPDSSMDARRGVANEQDDRHIRLRRPNTVLLLATVAGDRAYRGFYTGAIADELRRVDGVTDIHDMHMKAVDKMKKDASLPQLPEYRATLLQQLILPIDEPGRLLLAA